MKISSLTETLPEKLMPIALGPQRGRLKFSPAAISYNRQKQNERKKFSKSFKSIYAEPLEKSKRSRTVQTADKISNGLSGRAASIRKYSI